MSEMSFPSDGADFTDAQWAITQSSRGSAIVGYSGGPYALTVDAGAGNAVISPSTTTGVAQAIVNGFGHQIDAAVSLPFGTVTPSTTYYVALTYTPPASSSSPGVVALGLYSSAPPSTGGQVSLTLYTVAVPSSGGLAAATVTDTRRYFDTGWHTLPLQSGYTTGSPSPQFRVMGSTVRVRGMVTRTAGNFGAGAEFAALPTWASPTQTEFFAQAGSGGAFAPEVAVGTSGYMAVEQFSGGSANLYLAMNFTND